MDAEILSLFKKSETIDAMSYIDKINNISINSLNILLASLSDIKSLDSIISNYLDSFSPSTYAIIIKKYCEFNNYDNAIKYLEDVDCMKHCSNRHIEPILELIYREHSSNKLDLIEKLFNLYIENDIQMPSNTCVKFLIYYNKYCIDNIINNIKYFQLNFNSNRIDEKYTKLTYHDDKYLKNLKHIDISIQNKMRLIAKLSNNCKPLHTIIDFLENTAYDIIIDGANLGYYGNTYPLNQNYINNCLRYYINNGNNPLIILHKKHRNNFHMMKNWIYNKQIYFTDYGQNDDKYWFLATLIISLKSDVKIITNDEIRDHVLNILGNTGNKYTYLDLFKTKYMQKYTINKVTKKYTPIEKSRYNHTLYRLHNNYFGFPRNNKFYVL